MLVDPGFSGHVSPAMADVLLAALRIVSIGVIADTGRQAPSRCDDPDDDYPVDAAMATGSMLVSRDDHANFSRVAGLHSGRPGTALRAAGLLE